ncbi:MAG: alkene reductase [Alphaproteobacteria bacterium]
MPSLAHADDHSLFTAVSVGALRLPNRIVMAPMTRSRAGDDGVPSEHAALYYAQRAGAGLIVAEATQPSPGAQGYPRTPGIHTEAQISAWRNVTTAVHRAGGRIALQLWHCGRIAHPDNQPPGCRPVGPSAVAARGRIFTSPGLRDLPVPHALSQGEIRTIIDEFAAAARNAVAAGFDAVELHGANGYLIDAFLHDQANRRQDRYGGTLANRTRLLLETCEAMSAAIGADRVGLRLSPFGTFNDAIDSDSRALFAYVIPAVARLGLAYLHVINLEVTGDRSSGRAGEDVCRFARERYDGTLIAAGGYDRDSAEHALSRGDADLVAFGRAFIANPDLPLRFAQGWPLAAADRATFYAGGPRGYIDYPAHSGSPAIPSTSMEAAS